MRRAHLTPTRITLTALIVALALPVAAAAQTPPGPRPALPRFDAAAYAIWMGADAGDLPGEVYGTWDGAGAGGLSAGFYWTEHAKIEVSLEASADREIVGLVSVESGREGSRTVYQSHRIASRTLSMTAIYQLLHNTWVHPFVGAGVDVDWERRHTDTEIRNYGSWSGSGSNLDLLPNETAHDQRVRAALTTGAKFYLSPRAFLRTDLRVSFSSQFDAVRWRAGAGFDF